MRAADQIVPGATVTALQGGAKVTAFTDENGRYTLELTPGVWQIEVSMFEFTTAKGQVTVSDGGIAQGLGVEHAQALRTRWTGGRGGRATAAAPLPAAPGIGRGARGARGNRGADGQGGQRGYGNFPGRGGPRRTSGRRRAGRSGRPGRGTRRTGSGASRDFRVPRCARLRKDSRPTHSSRIPQQNVDLGGDADESLLVNGSVSGGLEQSSDDEARRQRAMGGRGGPGGPGGPGGRRRRGIGGTGFADERRPAAGNEREFDERQPGAGRLRRRARSTADSELARRLRPMAAVAAAAAEALALVRVAARRASAAAVVEAVAVAAVAAVAAAAAAGLGQNANGRGQAGRGGRGPFNGQFASIGNRRRTTPPVQGSIAITVRNSALNAAPYSLNGQTAQKPYSANNTLNANIGGPLHIPKIVNWQRAQYTISFGTTINRNGRSMVGSVPTAAERGGDFSQALTTTPVTIFDPLAGSPFPNNVIPTSRFDSASAGLLQYFPNPTYAGIVQNYRFVITDPSTSHNIGVRFNAPLSNKDRLNFNFQKQNQNSNSHQLFGFLDTGSSSGLSFSAGWSHSFRPRLNNSANFSISRSRSLNHAVLRVHAEHRGGVGDHRDFAGPDQLRTAGTFVHQFFQPERRHAEPEPQPDGDLHAITSPTC